MDEIAQAFAEAAQLIWHLDHQMTEIVLLSLRVSLSAVLLSTLVGLPMGAFLALRPFPGRAQAVVLINASMGLPPVVVGLVVYLLLSRSGPLGVLGLLFTPSAMIIAQMVVVAPIITALCRQVVADLWEEYAELLRSLCSTTWQSVATLLWDGRYRLVTAVLAGFGRAIGEVGAIIIVGGNIDHVTRTMTTAIALETSKGNLALALGLGLILIVLSTLFNAAAFLLQQSERHARA